MSNHFRGETGSSMVLTKITKKMRDKASDGVYRLSKQEHEEAKKRTEENKQRNDEHKDFKKQIHNTTYELLSNQLNTTVTKEMILASCSNYRTYGNGRFRIKCTDKDKLIIEIKKQKGTTYRMQIIR